MKKKISHHFIDYLYFIKRACFEKTGFYRALMNVLQTCEGSFKKIVALNVCLLCIVILQAQSKPQIIEIEEEYTTYPFSDPNPIPALGKIYPYFRFDGYTTQSVKKKYKIICLENDYLKIKIFPEIGGKIWSVVDKTCGKEMFYDNKVIKFRDISLRGPWTSGGIEFNYGVIGHDPSSSFPVNYRTAHNPDGSVSCWISNLDLITRTRWSVEINLPKDKGWFTTTSFWHNSNSGSQPYYNWVNTGIKATEDLELIYPGTYSIGHGGDIIPWPMDQELGKNLSHWVDNDFEGSKSYHVAGTYDKYFGAYWGKENFGMMHVSDRDEKVGKKFFTWALSDEGNIWEELLTDTNGQYLEVQSGRLFNQNEANSSLTPYKQIYFAPYSTDVWTEYWFPFKNTGGVVDASLYGVINIKEGNGTLDFVISPLKQVNDTLKLYDAEGEILSSQPITLSVAKTYNTNLRFSAEKSVHKIALCNRTIWSKEDKTLNRPNSESVIFDYNTAYGKYILGRDYSGMRYYNEAKRHIKESLELDPNYIPSLVEMSRLFYRSMDYDSAYFYARKALSFDTYHPDANFEYGRSARQLGKIFDSLDGYEIAAISTPMRSAAYTEISKIYFASKEYDKAEEYAEKSLINNSLNIEGLQLLYLSYKKNKDLLKSAEIAERIKTIDPFNLLILFETTFPDTHLFLEKFHTEMPDQSVLELAIWYYSLGLNKESRTLLKAIPESAEAKYWLAFLSKDTYEETTLLQEADLQNPSFEFPFRSESKEVFEWAISKSKNWKPVYYMALLQGSVNNFEATRDLLVTLGDQPDFSPFYSLRASFTYDDMERERDLIKAVSLSPTEWRYNHRLTNHYLEKQEFVKATQTIKPLYAKHKDHFPTASLYARALMSNRQYLEADKILNAIHILPFEGERGGRVMYREIKMMLAIQALAKGKTNRAEEKVFESLQWPRNLGVGKPYDDQIDTRLEDWMLAMIAIKLNRHADKESYLKKVAQSTHSSNNLATLLQCIAWSQLGEQQKANDLFVEWSSYQDNSNTLEWGGRFFKENCDKEYPFDVDVMTQVITAISRVHDARLF